MNTTNKRDEIRRQQNKPGYVGLPWFKKELLKALDEIDELHGLERLFEMQHSRSQEADKRWQDATGKHDTIPDLGDLLQWLMAEIDRLKQEYKASQKRGQQQAEMHKIVTDQIEQQTKEACIKEAEKFAMTYATGPEGWVWQSLYKAMRECQAIDSAKIK